MDIQDAQLIESAVKPIRIHYKLKILKLDVTEDLKVASLKPDRAPVSLLTTEPGKYHVEVSGVTSTYDAAARSRAVAVTPIAAGRDEVSAWAGLCCNTPASEGFSHCWHSLSGAETCGGKKARKILPRSLKPFL